MLFYSQGCVLLCNKSLVFYFYSAILFSVRLFNMEGCGVDLNTAYRGILEHSSNMRLIFHSLLHLIKRQ
jgi:hypothetical protein